MYGFRLTGLQIQFKYMSASISTTTEVALVLLGPVGNIVLFSIFIAIGATIYKVHYIYANHHIVYIFLDNR